MAFTPAEFTTPVVAPQTATMFRSVPYISPSEYRFAPTAVDTNALVAGSTNQATDSLASLAQVIARASGEIDTWCFHRGAGTLAASVTTESDWLRVRSDSTITAICNFKPILEIVGMGIGPAANLVQDIDSSAAQTITIGEKTFTLQSPWASATPVPMFAIWPTVNGQVYAVWSYVNGFPHVALSANANSGDTSITVTPSALDGSTVVGVYKNTSLTIHDGAKTEVVVASGTPSALSISLESPLQYSHTVPSQPDFIRVSAIPWAVEQACISLTSFYIKARGNRAMELPRIGSRTAKVLAGQAGASDDYETAMRLLKPFQTVYLH